MVVRSSVGDTPLEVVDTADPKAAIDMTLFPGPVESLAGILVRGEDFDCDVAVAHLWQRCLRAVDPNRDELEKMNPYRCSYCAEKGKLIKLYGY